MTIPTDGFSLASYLALIVPGVIFILVRAQFRGFREVDRTVGGRLLLAFVVSAIFDALYLAMLGPAVYQRLQESRALEPQELATAAWLFVLLAIIIPAAVSYFIYGDGPILRTVHRQFARLKSRITDSRYEATPTAWDLAATTTRAGWVRIRLDDRVWVGGRFGPESYFSTYPEPRDLFIEQQWTMGELGAFLVPVENSAGVWLAIRDEYLVEWLHDSKDEDSGDSYGVESTTEP